MPIHPLTTKDEMLHELERLAKYLEKNFEIKLNSMSVYWTEELINKAIDLLEIQKKWLKK